MGALDEISRAIGTLEGQVRDQNDALRDSRRDLGREIGELKEMLAEHAKVAGALERDGFRRIQALEDRLDALDKAQGERDRRQQVNLGLIGLAFTVVNVVIAVVGLLLR